MILDGYWLDDRKMKRLLFVVLITVCSVSWAGWEKICKAGCGDGEFERYYYDKSTIRKNGAISRMLHLIDYSIYQADNSARWSSVKVLQAYNCKDETSAIISLFLYEGNMGEGENIYSITRQEREWEWEPIAPGSTDEIRLKIACGKK